MRLTLKLNTDAVSVVIAACNAIMRSADHEIDAHARDGAAAVSLYLSHAPRREVRAILARAVSEVHHVSA